MFWYVLGQAQSSHRGAIWDRYRVTILKIYIKKEKETGNEKLFSF